MNTIPNIRAWDGKRMRHAEIDRIHSIARLSVAVDVETMTALEDSDVPLHELELSWGSGLHDKNGIEIFQDDIIERNHGYNLDGSPWLNLSYFRVVFENACFGYYWLGEINEDDAGFKPFYNEERELLESKYMEIIGNTYQNPELVK